MSILDYVYSPTSGYVGNKIRDYVHPKIVEEFDKEKARRVVEHQFKDSIGGDSSNYKEDK